VKEAGLVVQTHGRASQRGREAVRLNVGERPCVSTWERGRASQQVGEAVCVSTWEKDRASQQVRKTLRPKILGLKM